MRLSASAPRVRLANQALANPAASASAATSPAWRRSKLGSETLRRSMPMRMPPVLPTDDRGVGTTTTPRSARALRASVVQTAPKERNDPFTEELDLLPDWLRRHARNVHAEMDTGLACERKRLSHAAGDLS